MSRVPIPPGPYDLSARLSAPLRGRRAVVPAECYELERNRATEARGRIAALEAVIEADRTRIIDGVNAVKAALNSRFWLTEGRGHYEWDDDRYREEFRDAANAVLEAFRLLETIGADLSNCPQTTKDVIKARQDKEARIAALESDLAAARGREAALVAALAALKADFRRHRQKNGIEDLKKARWYLDRFIAREEARNG